MNRYISLIYITSILSILFLNKIYAQEVSFSIPEKGDSKNKKFEIIGKIRSNYLVYKNSGSNHYITTFDNTMAKSTTLKLKNFPDKLVDLNPICYYNKAYLIYQNQKRNTVTCYASILNELGEQQGEPIALDTAIIKDFVNEKLYKVLVSDNKQYIMIIKAQGAKKSMKMITSLFDKNLTLIKKSEFPLLTYNEAKEDLTEFTLDNTGNFYFIYGKKSSDKEFYKEVKLIEKKINIDTLSTTNIGKTDNFYDDLKIKNDPVNNQVLVCGLFYTKRRGNVDGYFSASINKSSKLSTNANHFLFPDSLRNIMKKKGANKESLNNLYLKDIFLKKDGGYLIYAEDISTMQRNSQSYNNRWDNYNNFGQLNNWDYYSFNNSWNNSSYFNNNSFNRNLDRYYYDNILVMSITNKSELQWTNVIYKDQTADGSIDMLSYFAYPLQGGIHLLYNQIDRRSTTLVSYSTFADGKIKRNINIKDGEQGYEYLMRYSKQVDVKEIFTPCYYNGLLCFGLIKWK